MRGAIEGLSPKEPDAPRRTVICSPSRVVDFDGGITVIGERLNPTGKKALQAALRAHDTDYLLREALRQQEQGAQALDLNTGLPDIDEAAALAEAAQKIQAVTPLPLQLDSSSPAALERAARLYNGKPLLNSVNGKKESLESILPIAKKYGCAVLGLALDENGVPKTAEARLEIARRIVAAAEAAGIPREDVLIDCLVMTASAQQEQAAETLKALALVKKELGVKTVLGVSNVSFGLPMRPVVNRTMLAMAFAMGLDAPIMNPGDAGMSETVAAAPHDARDGLRDGARRADNEPRRRGNVRDRRRGARAARRGQRGRRLHSALLRRRARAEAGSEAGKPRRHTLRDNPRPRGRSREGRRRAARGRHAADVRHRRKDNPRARRRRQRLRDRRDIPAAAHKIRRSRESLLRGAAREARARGRRAEGREASSKPCARPARR